MATTRPTKLTEMNAHQLLILHAEGIVSKDEIASQLDRVKPDLNIEQVAALVKSKLWNPTEARSFIGL